MTSPISPRLLKGGLVLLDPNTSAVLRIIVLQYNPDTLSRSLQIQGVGESGDRSEALRIKAPAVETIKLDAEIDATDQLEGADSTATQLGIHPQLAALETLAHPTSRQLQRNNQLVQTGSLEIIPMETPLTIFVWSKSRIMPVRLTELSITEDAFDPALNPIRAKVSLGMRVLSVNDLGFTHKGGSLFMNHLRQKERLADRARAGGLGVFGIGGLP
jgi:hypothetical protein